jgi:hypothetical protein
MISTPGIGRGDFDMLDFSKGYSVEEYFLKGYEEERDRQKRACDRAVFLPGFDEAVRAVTEPVFLAAFAEIYCPDTVTAMPFVKRAADLNPLVRLAVFERDPFAAELEAATGAKKIPTFLFYDSEMKVRGRFVELPDELIELMGDADPDERSCMNINYRRGRYNDLIQKQIMAILAAFSG